MGGCRPQSHEAKRSILNFVSTALGSANYPAVTAALRALSPFSGAATSAIIGRSERLDAISAASSTRFRPTCSILTIPIWIRSFIRRPRSQRRCWRWRKHGVFPAGMLLPHSFSAWRWNAGSATRFSGHYARGWHITSTCGVFGAAAACAIAGAFGGRDCKCDRNCGESVRGDRRKSSDAAKNVSIGNAARNGLFAALLAAEDYSRRRGRSRDRSAGLAPWATNPISNACRRSWQDLGDRKEYLQALSGRHRISCRDRRLLQFAGENSTSASMISRPSRCKARRCCWRAATVRFATNAMRGSVSIIAPPARYCRVRQASRSLRTQRYFGPTSCPCARR